jgi:hypothetical protein
MRLSKNFKLSEFNNVEPEKNLLTILQAVRDEFDSPVVITDSTRTVQQHIDIYKRLYGDEWLDKIPWGSRHLPAYGRGLRAVDFKVKKEDGFLSGKEVAEVVKRVAKSITCLIGLGVGKEFIHLDVDRSVDAEWGYNY